MFVQFDYTTLCVLYRFAIINMEERATCFTVFESVVAYGSYYSVVLAHCVMGCVYRV